MINIRPSDISPLPPVAFSDPSATGALPVAALPSTGNAASGPFGAGLSAVLQERLRQIEQHGHTPEADAGVPLAHFYFVLERMAGRAFQRHKTGAPLFVLRKQLVALAAFILAMIDRIDAGETQQGAPQP